MSLDLNPLKETRRLLFQIPLQPLQGKRFQPTGFPDLGAATYQTGTGTCLLVESAQSMANRLENTVWDSASNQPVSAVQGISYIRVVDDSGEFLTSSITEAHRINSPYILEGKDKSFLEKLQEELDVKDSGPIDRKSLAKTLLKYDANSLLHGVFLAKKELSGGRYKLARSISSFIEAENIGTAASGGVKNDHVDPKGEASKGFGNVPFHREEFTAETITAYFNVDLQQIRAFGLSDDATDMLITLALFKIRRLLDGDLRLRTACDLEVVFPESIKSRSPIDFELPKLVDLEAVLEALIAKCKSEMTVETVKYEK